jgi:hypothetical protein
MSKRNARLEAHSKRTKLNYTGTVAPTSAGATDVQPSVQVVRQIDMYVCVFVLV